MVEDDRYFKNSRHASFPLLLIAIALTKFDALNAGSLVYCMALHAFEREVEEI